MRVLEGRTTLTRPSLPTTGPDVGAQDEKNMVEAARVAAIGAKNRFFITLLCKLFCIVQIVILEIFLVDE